MYEGANVGDEFVETEYYKDLGGVGEQHHTVDTTLFNSHLLLLASSSRLLLFLVRANIWRVRADRNGLHQDGQS